MTMNSTQVDNSYALQGIMNVHFNPYDKTVESYFIAVGKRHHILQVLDHFIQNIDDPEFVTVFSFGEEEKSIKQKNDERKNGITCFVQFNVLKEDIEKIGKDEPIHIKCLTDIFPNNKEAFVDSFKELYSIMRS